MPPNSTGKLGISSKNCDFSRPPTSPFFSIRITSLPVESFPGCLFSDNRHAEYTPAAPPPIIATSQKEYFVFLFLGALLLGVVFVSFKRLVREALLSLLLSSVPGL